MCCPFFTVQIIFISLLLHQNYYHDLKPGSETLEKLQERTESDGFHEMSANFNKVQKRFIEMILRNHSRHPNARVFSNEEKIIALSIYETSPECYRYLRSIIGTLPSPTTLKTVLKNISTDTGVNAATIKRLQEAAKLCTTEQEKVMLLLWDELLLSTGLQYDNDTDKIVGFEDFGNVRSDQFADRALAFMLHSVQSGDSLPICFSLSDGQTKSVQLQCCIKEVVKAVKDAGFTIIASVCDGTRTNESAINTMIDDTKKIKGEEFVQRRKYLFSLFT